jgi:hypothetical protein
LSGSYDFIYDIILLILTISKGVYRGEGVHTIEQVNLPYVISPAEFKSLHPVPERYPMLKRFIPEVALEKLNHESSRWLGELRR